MTLPNTIAELFRNGAAPDAEDVVNLKDIGSFAATVLARYSERPRREVGAQSESMLAGLAGARGGLSSASDWLDSLALGGLVDDGFWQGISRASTTHFGYGDMEAERGFLNLMEEEGLTPAEAAAEMPQRRKGRTGLVGRRGSPHIHTAASRAHRGLGEGSEKAAASRGFVMSGGDHMVAATLRSLIAGGLPVVDQVIARVDETVTRRRSPGRAFSLDGMTVDDRLPALSASLAEASLNHVAPSRMGIAEPAPLESTNPNAYAFFDAVESVFLGLDEGLAGLGSSGVPSSPDGVSDTLSLRDRTMFPTSHKSTPRAVQLAALGSHRGERRAMVAPSAAVQQANKSRTALPRAEALDLGSTSGQHHPASLPASPSGAIGTPGKYSQAVSTARRAGAAFQPTERFAERLVHRPDGAMVPRESRSLVGGVDTRLASIHNVGLGQAAGSGSRLAAVRPAPLGAGFTGYESFAAQKIVERGLSVEQTVLPSFDPTSFGALATDRPPIGAASRAASREAAMGGWVNSAVDGAVWLSVDMGDSASTSAGDFGSRATRPMGLAAVSERRNVVQAPAAMAANALLASSFGAGAASVNTAGPMNQSATIPTAAPQLSIARILREHGIVAPRAMGAFDSSDRGGVSAPLGADAAGASRAMGGNLQGGLTSLNSSRQGASDASGTSRANTSMSLGAPAIMALEVLVKAARSGQSAANPGRSAAAIGEAPSAMSDREAAAGPLGRAGLRLGVLRNAMLRPVPTAREAMLAQSSAAGTPPTEIRGMQSAFRLAQLNMAGIGEAFGTGSNLQVSGRSDIGAVGRGVAPKHGHDLAVGSFGTDLKAIGGGAAGDPLIGGRVGAVREMLLRAGWSQPELGLLTQDGVPGAAGEVAETTSRGPSDRIARNLARVVSGALTVGGSVASSTAGAATANAAARQQASAYLGMLSGRGADTYFGTSAPALGLVARTAAAAPSRAVANALGELGQMASGDVMRTDNPVPVGVRRQVVANIRASESASRSLEKGNGSVPTTQSVLSALVDQGYAPQAFLDRDASGVYLSMREIEQGLASSTLPATGRAQLLARLQAIPGAMTMGIAPSTFGSTFAGFASTIGLLSGGDGIGGGVSRAAESYTLRALAERGVVEARLADRAAAGEFLTMADVETSFAASSLPNVARERVLAAVKAASGSDGRIEGTAFQSVVAAEVRSLAPRTTGSQFEARTGATWGRFGALAESLAPVGAPATGLQALADRGVVPSRLAAMATSGDFLTIADVESGLVDSTLPPEARQRVLEAMRNEAGTGTSVHRRSIERALAGELAVAKATSGAGLASIASVSGASLVPASAQPAALRDNDTSNRAMSIAPLGGIVALADRGVVPMALADRAMLGEFVSVAEIERVLADGGVNAEVRRRAMETLGTSMAGTPSDSAAVDSSGRSALTRAATAVVPATATHALGVSAGREWLEARASARLGTNSSAAMLHALPGLAVGAHAGEASRLALGAPEMSLLARDSGDLAASGGVGSRLAEAMALSAAGPAGASRLIGTPVKTAARPGKSNDSALPRGLGAALQPGETTARPQTSAMGYVKGWNASSAASSEERTRNLPVGLDRVLAPEVMLSGMRSLELNRVVREMSIRGAAGFESLGILTTLADSGVDLGAGRTALARDAAGTVGADASSLGAQRLLDRVQHAGGASASGALSDILVKGVDPIEAVSRARLSKRERAGLLSSILKGAERAETASIFEGAGGADFAFEWLARVDGSRSGVDVGAGEARAATVRTFGAQRDSRVALSSPMGGANLVDSARRGRGDDTEGIAAHARPVAGAVAGSASRSDAIRRTDWRLVDTGAAATTSHADLGKLASALVGSSGSTASAMPMALVAPAVKSVAQSALRAPSNEQAKSSAPVQDKTAGSAGAAGAGEFSLDDEALDLLAVEMAGLVADLLRQDEERTGRWQ